MKKSTKIQQPKNKAYTVPASFYLKETKYCEISLRRFILVRVGAILPPLTIILSCSHDILARRAAWRIHSAQTRQLQPVPMLVVPVDSFTRLVWHSSLMDGSLAQSSDTHNNNPPPPTFSRQKSSLVWDSHDFV